MGALEELSKLLQGSAVVSADITNEDLKGVDIYQIAAIAKLYFANKQGIKIFDKKVLEEIIKELATEKAPKQLISVQEEEKREEKAVRYVYINSKIEFVTSSATEFVSHFNNRYEKLKRILLSGRRNFPAIDIAEIEQYAEGREVSIVGMVYDKKTTKNGHVLVTLEDPTGSVNVLFARPESSRFASQDAGELYNDATKIAKDDVIGVRGKLSKGLVIGKELLWPDIPVQNRRRTEDDFAIALLSDIHVGHKLFLEKQFAKMLDWLNGRLDYENELAKKVRFAIFCGDLVEGIGVYPNQEKELIVDDIYTQYAIFFELLKGIPDSIEVFVLPGNHDAVRRAEPQPELDRELAKYNTGNVHLLTNPAKIKLEELNILAYHGTSLDSVIANIPGNTYAKPEEAMVQLLKRRHLSPIFGDNPIVPNKDDQLVIDEAPDVLLMGHIHKNGARDYHGTLVVNSGTWQARTLFQIKQGHIPTPAILPVYEAKKGVLNLIDFNRVLS